MNASDRIPTAILGASGYIGQHFARLLARHPTFARPLLVGSEHSAGQRLEDLWQLTEEVPRELSQERLRPLSRPNSNAPGSALCSGRSRPELAGPIESECRHRGIHVFTNSADHRLDPDVPLLVPEG